MDLFELETARQREAERRLKLLGNCAQHEYDTKLLRDLAREKFVPARFLAAYKHAYELHGLEGLFPRDWVPLSATSQQKIAERLAALGSLAEAEAVTYDDIIRKAERWVRRYRIGGLWALDPKRDPEKPPGKRGKPPPQAIASLTKEGLLDTVLQRLEMIKPFINQTHVSDAAVEKHATKLGIARSRLWGYIMDYRNYGADGLLPKEPRSDKGLHHNMSERMIHLIQGLRLSKPDRPIHEAHRIAGEKARLLGEPVPSKWQVRAVCEQIPAAVLAIADRRYNEYRNKHRITHRFFFDGSIIIYQVDFTQVDMLVKDIRDSSLKKKSGAIRPYLTICIEASARLLMAAIFSYDVPDKFTIAEVIRDALLTSRKKPYGGVPDEIWVDRGQQMISKHVQRIAQELHIVLHDCVPLDPEDRGNPQEKGIVERFFETLNTVLWCTLDGYVNSNTTDRNPNAEAKLTLAELANKFWEHIAKYHNEEHSETHQTPLAFWNEHCYAPLIESPRKLDDLLQISEQRKLLKVGIKYARRVYWDEEFGTAIPVGAQVHIRAHPRDVRPDDIEVYYQDQWICTAKAIDSEEGRAVTGRQVALAQRRQKREIQNTIAQARNVVGATDREIEKQKKKLLPKEEPNVQEEQKERKASAPKPHHERPTSPSTGPQSAKKHKTDVWDDLLSFAKSQERGGQ